MLSSNSNFIFYLIFKFDLGADRTIHMRVTSLLVSHRHIMGKFCLARDFISDWIFIKLADNKDMHKISDKFDFGPVSTIGIRFTCP